MNKPKLPALLLHFIRNYFFVFWKNIEKISQLGLLLLAIFGYIYTVIPVYQKELLNEQIAHNNISISKQKNKISILNIEINKLKKNLQEYRNTSKIYYNDYRNNTLFIVSLSIMAKDYFNENEKQYLYLDESYILNSKVIKLFNTDDKNLLHETLTYINNETKKKIDILNVKIKAGEEKLTFEIKKCKNINDNQQKICIENAQERLRNIYSNTNHEYFLLQELASSKIKDMITN